MEDLICLLATVRTLKWLVYRLVLFALDSVQMELLVKVNLDLEKTNQLGESSKPILFIYYIYF